MKPKVIILSSALVAFLATNAVSNSMAECQRLNDKILALSEDAQRLIDGSPKGLSASGSANVANIHAEITRLQSTVTAMEKQEANSRWLAEVPPGQRPDLSLEQDGITGEDARAIQQFSIVRMLLATATGDRSKLTPVELHVSAMATKEATEKGFGIRGIGVPAAAMRYLSFRNDMSATGGSLLEGGNTIRKEYQPLITPLVEESILTKLGVTVFDNLQGNLEFPVISTLGTPATKIETGAADELTATTSVKTMSPRRLPAVIDITTQMLRQDSAGIQQYLLKEMKRQFATVIDNQALNGNGTGVNPTGLLNTAGVGAVAIGTNGGPPTWAQVVALETKVDVANAITGGMAYLTSKNGKGVLKTTQRVSGQSQMLWESNQVNGYDAYATNLIGSAGTKGSGTGLTSLIFGNWEDMILGTWGGLDIVTVQDRAQAITGMKSIVMEGFYDILVRRAASFAVCTDMNSA